MKKLLLVCAAATATFGMMAQAPTENELLGKTIAVMLNGNSFQLSLPVATMGSSFSKGSNGLVLNNFYDGLPANFTYSGGKLTLTDYNGGYSPYAEQGQKILGMFTKAKNGMYTATVDGTQTQVMCWEPSGDTSFGNFTSTVAQGTSDLYGWAFGEDGYTMLLEYYDVTNGTSDATLMDIQAFNYFQVYAMSTNANVREYVNGVPSDMYPVDVKIDGENISIKNFLNQGMSATVDASVPSYSLGFVSGTVDMENGLVNLPIQTIMGDVDFNFEGSYLGNGQLFDDGPTGYWFNYVGTDYYPWQLIDGASYNSATGEASGLVGTITVGASAHTGTNPWVGFDGDCATTSETTITFENVGVYGAYYEDIIGSADKMEIVSQTENTADVELKVSKANYYSSNGTAMGSLLNSKNSDNVAYYDIYAVPGKYTSVNDAAFHIDSETGHTDAFLVYDGSMETSLEYVFAANFDCGELANEGNKDFTFFVKTNYKPETGLTPTFHALTNVNATNAVEDITAEDAAVVSAANGQIEIIGTDADATVFTPAGATVYSGAKRNIPVAAGIYLVKVGKNVTKVTVK